MRARLKARPTGIQLSMNLPRVEVPELGRQTFKHFDDTTRGANGSTGPDALPKEIMFPRRPRQSNESCQVDLPTFLLPLLSERIYSVIDTNDPLTICQFFDFVENGVVIVGFDDLFEARFLG